MASFHGRIRRWREDKPGGLAVIGIPSSWSANSAAGVRCA
jgi:hypothetical protein